MLMTFVLLLHFEKKCSIRLPVFQRTVETRKKRIASDRNVSPIYRIESKFRKLYPSVCRSVGLSVCHAQLPNPFLDFDETRMVNRRSLENLNAGNVRKQEVPDTVVSSFSEKI